MSKKILNPITNSVLQENIDKVKDLINEDSEPRKILNSVVEKTEGIEELFTSDKSLDEKIDDFKELLGEDSAVGKVLGSIDDKVDKFKELVGEDSAARKMFDSFADKAEGIGELFTSDQSLEEKLGNFKELLGDDSPAGKIMGLVETLPKEARSLINTLNVAGEHGLPAEHLEGILAFKESA